MLVTELADSEIVLGKLAARLLPVLALVTATIPVLALSGLLGGIIFEAILSLTLDHRGAGNLRLCAGAGHSRFGRPKRTRS